MNYLEKIHNIIESHKKMALELDSKYVAFPNLEVLYDRGGMELIITLDEANEQLYVQYLPTHSTTRETKEFYFVLKAYFENNLYLADPLECSRVGIDWIYDSWIPCQKKNGDTCLIVHSGEKIYIDDDYLLRVHSIKK